MGRPSEEIRGQDKLDCTEAETTAGQKEQAGPGVCSKAGCHHWSESLSSQICPATHYLLTRSSNFEDANIFFTPWFLFIFGNSSSSGLSLCHNLHLLPFILDMVNLAIHIHMYI